MARLENLKPLRAMELSLLYLLYELGVSPNFPDSHEIYGINEGGNGIRELREEIAKLVSFYRHRKFGL